MAEEMQNVGLPILQLVLQFLGRRRHQLASDPRRRLRLELPLSNVKRDFDWQSGVAASFSGCDEPVELCGTVDLCRRQEPDKAQRLREISDSKFRAGGIGDDPENAAG